MSAKMEISEGDSEMMKSFIGCGILVFLALLAGPAPGAAQGDLTVVNGAIVIPVDGDLAPVDGESTGDVTVKGGVWIQSIGGQIAGRLQRAIQSGLVPYTGSIVKGDSRRGGGSDAGVRGNVQVNDGAIDHIVTFDPAVVNTRPFEFATQSETSSVKDGRHIVVGYNSSAGSEVSFIPGLGLAFTKLMFSGVSTSHDGGKTWTSGFVPSVSPQVPFTFGDPSLAMDRDGNIYYASLGTDLTGAHNGLIINKSTDHGSSFGTATVVAVDDGSDKEWLAIGPDPKAPWRDNLYVTWTSFNKTGSTLNLARSTDDGQTFQSQVLFAPGGDAINSTAIQFSNPVVDASNGRLYIPFLHFSNVDADNVRVLVSDDGGVTLKFLAFNVPGAVDAYAYPNVTPGLINDCKGGGFRNTLVAGPDQGGGRFGLPQFKQATRLVTQPNAAAANGKFALVLNSNVSPFFGDSSAGSEINVLFSRNGGASWAPTFKVAAATATDVQHVHPAIALSGENLTVSYYVQQADQRLRTDAATFSAEDGRLRLRRVAPLSSTAFDLPPSNVVRTRTANTNFDRAVTTCYAIGEYQSLATSQRGNDDEGSVFAAWGDMRRTWTSPVGSPAVGTHSQPDVFSATVRRPD